PRRRSRHRRIPPTRRPAVRDMPLQERLPVGPDTAQWPLWGTVARIVVTNERRLDDATEIARAELAAVEEACSRFRPDSELERVHRQPGQPVQVSHVLADLVATALDVAADTDGDVDPTVGAALIALGYDRDFAALPDDGDGGGPVTVVPAADWRRVTLNGDS